MGQCYWADRSKSIELAVGNDGQPVFDQNVPVKEKLSCRNELAEYKY